MGENIFFSFNYMIIEANFSEKNRFPDNRQITAGVAIKEKPV
jgi:hypothetical protein